MQQIPEGAVWVLCATAATTALALRVRRSSWRSHVATFAILPLLVLFACWSVGTYDYNWFHYAKTFFVCLGTLYIAAMRFTDVRERTASRPLGFALLWVNILMAVVAEVAEGTASATVPNAIAGVALLLSQPLPRFIGVPSGSASPDLHYDLGWPWIMGYTLWNFTFVYGAVSGGALGGVAAFAVVHLGVPLLLSLRDPRLWMQSRAYALSLLMIYRMVLPAPPFMPFTPTWYSAEVHGWLGTLSLGMGIALLVAVAVRLLRRSPPRTVLEVVMSRG